jgi:hypothetical protein
VRMLLQRGVVECRTWQGQNQNTGRLSMKSRIAIALSFVSILAVASAYGQSPSPVLGRVDIPFKFMVGKKELPAGKYEVMKVEGDQAHLRLHDVQGKASMFVFIIERLAETDPFEKHGARVVFDTIGDQRFLSEFWPANNGDGYLLGINKGEQKHKVIQGK